MLDRDACIAALALAGYEAAVTPTGVPVFINRAKEWVIYTGQLSPTQRAVICRDAIFDIERFCPLTHPCGFNIQEFRWMAAAAHRLSPGESLLCCPENSI